MQIRLFAPALALMVMGWGSNQFAPLVVTYQLHAGLSVTDAQMLFVVSTAGLVPGLFLGGMASDRMGRRRVVLWSLGLLGLSTGVLWVSTAGGASLAGLTAGRLLAGLASGMGFSAGAAWVKECAVGAHGPRQAVTAMTLGFSGGPLVAGVIAAAWPAHFGLAYAPHALLTLITLTVVGLGTQGEPIRAASQAAAAARAGILRDPVFRRVVVPLAPWVFLTASVALATIPGALRAGAGTALPWFVALVTPLPALTGVLVQRLMVRLQERLCTQLRWGFVFCTLGLALGTAAVGLQSMTLGLMACAVLGMAYGVCQTIGMQLIARLSPPAQLGRSTAIYQTLTYLGYLAPLPIAALSRHVPLPFILLALTVAAALTGVWLLAQLRHLAHARA